MIDQYDLAIILAIVYVIALSILAYDYHSR
jgi:hypothetical protein